MKKPKRKFPVPKRTKTIHLKKYAVYVQEKATERREEQGKKMRMSDFYAGAMCVFFFLNSQLEIPGSWILGVMAGRPFPGEPAKPA
jgi:hypothetical protein